MNRNTFVITSYRDGLLFGLWQGNHPVTLQRFQEETLLDSIYVGRVQNVVQNIQAVFVDIGTGEPLFLAAKEKKHRPGGNYKIGEELLVQVSREATGKKPAQLSDELSFTGHYVVLLEGESGIGISSKIRDDAWRQKSRERYTPFLSERYGFILRTESYEAEPEEVERELLELVSLYEDCREKGAHRPAGTLLYRAENAYERLLLGLRSGELDRIVTDVPKVHEKLSSFLRKKRPDLACLCELYTGMPSLSTVYAVETELERALSKKVWLRSGGYLYIEPTEALTVIDVNSGGSEKGKKDPLETYFLINEEATLEICRQLRLRNLSGIIVIDFVNMRSQRDRDKIWQLLEETCNKDPVPTYAVDFTRLGLAELTRKKVYRPLAEQFS